MLERLKGLRLNGNFSQRSLAEKAGASQKSIDNWEKGVADPSAEFVIKLADIFGCSADYLLGREDDFGNVNINSDLDSEARELIYYFDKCDKSKKSALIQFAEYLASQSEKY